LVEYFGQNTAGDLRPVATKGESASWVIHDEHAAAELKLKGSLLDSHTGTESVDKSTVTDKLKKDEQLVTVYQVRTKIQDIDFYFGYNLNITANLIRATFLPQANNKTTASGKRGGAVIVTETPCVFTGDKTVVCVAEITHINHFLTDVGLPIVVSKGATDAVGLFLIGDHGSIDKWNRPLEGGFTIVLIPPSEPAGLAVPIAALVILPVIAAVTAAAIAAAWILLGQRAQDYAGASFDAFSVASEGGGSVSPLYDSRGLEVHSSIYAGANGGGSRG